MRRNAAKKTRGPFALWLKARREERFPDNVSGALVEFARISGRLPSRSTWSEWENGPTPPKAANRAVLAEMFGGDAPAVTPPDVETWIREDERRATRQMIAEELRPILQALREVLDELRSRAR